MKRRSPKPIAPARPLSRRAATQSPLPIVYVYCEGKITEPHYLTSFYQEHCHIKKVVLAKIVGGGGVPFTLVEKCVAKQQEIRRAAKADSFEKDSFVWAVFDVDVHPKLEEAIGLAKANGIRCAISNPCIEIWGLMHLSVFERPSTRHEAQAALANAMPPYHHDNSPIIPWDQCKSKVEDAIKNAETALKRRADDGLAFPKGNPSTSFFELLLVLAGEQNPKNILK